MPFGPGPVARPKDSHFRRGEKDLAEGVHPRAGFFVRPDSRLTELIELSQSSPVNLELQCRTAFTTSERHKEPGIEVAASSSLFWRGFLSNVFNPKSVLFFISVVPGFIRYDSSGSGLLLQATRLGAIYVAIATTIHASIVLLASQLRPLLIAGTHENTVRRILAFALVLVAAWLAWSTRRV